ncbi:hypothetical protein CHH80_11060 [Bacillus sp. 7504-2]|nr:hypothetical protein CHH80_11060 [Bacillus sp. 7504-2]
MNQKNKIKHILLMFFWSYISIFCISGMFAFIIVTYIEYSSDELTIFEGIVLTIFSLLFAFLSYKSIRKIVSLVRNRNTILRSDRYKQNRSNTSVIVSTPTPTPTTTPPETLMNMRGYYDEMKISAEINIINDCLYLVRNSKNLETVINRLELGAQKAYLVEQLEQAGLYNNEPTSRELIDIFIGQKSKIINDCIEKSYKNMLKKAEELKTQRGKINRYNKFIEELHKYDDDYTLENEDYIKEIEQELNLLISLSTSNAFSR